MAYPFQLKVFEDSLCWNGYFFSLSQPGYSRPLAVNTERIEQSAPRTFEPIKLPIWRNSNGTNSSAHRIEEVASTYSWGTNTAPLPRLIFFAYVKVINASSIVMSEKRASSMPAKMASMNKSNWLMLLRRANIVTTLLRGSL